MSNYLGQSPTFGDFPFQILTGNGGSSYTLTYKVSGENGMLVFLNGAVQRPGIDYTAKGSLLTFSSSVPSGVQIFTYGMGLPKSTLAPSDGASLATPSQFDDSQKIATTEFVQRALGNTAGLTVLASSTALTAVHCGRLLQCFGGSAAAITLPPSASLAVGAVIKLWSNATAPFVVYPQGADTITDGVTIPATVTVNTGDSVTFEYKGGGSWIMQGALQIGRSSSMFGSSLAAIGYQKLPSGMIMQWGTVSAALSGTAITFPIAFPNACLGLYGVDNGSTTLSTSNDVGKFAAGSTTLSGGTVYASSSCNWFAIGY